MYAEYFELFNQGSVFYSWGTVFFIFFAFFFPRGLIILEKKREKKFKSATLLLF